ncbi:MAG: outer membrane beta-barrel protein, partial [Porphyromonas sp.]|nr:outer membrane beta-barrel protein [Porphyromonas sp.]
VFITSLLGFTITTGRLQAQDKKQYSIQVTIVEKATGRFAAGASARLLHAKDSSLYKGNAANAKGHISIENVASGKYIFRVTYMGFQTRDSLISVAGDKMKLDFGKIFIAEEPQTLSDVVVTKYLAPVTVKKDTTEFNASSFKVREGASVEELIKKLPGMEVSDNGDIKYNGESIEGLQLDGRDFFTDNITMGTRNLLSDMVDRLQVVDKKSDQSRLTGMSDGGNKKIINLVVKQERKKGLMGNVSAGYGTENRYDLNSMVNAFMGNTRLTLLGNSNNLPTGGNMNGMPTDHSIGLNLDQNISKKLSFVTDITYDDNRNRRKGYNLNTELLGGGNKSQQNDQYFDNLSGDRSFRANTRMEWRPDSLTTIFVRPAIRYNLDLKDFSQTHTTYLPDGTKINEGERTEVSKSDNLRANLAFHAARRLNRAGRNILVGGFLTYRNGTEESNVKSKTIFHNQAGNEINLDQNIIQANDGTSAFFRTSWVEPIAKKFYLQLEYNPSLSFSGSDRRAYNKDAAGAYMIQDPLYSKNTEYNMISNSFGFNFRYNTGKGLNAQLGFAWVPTTTESKYGLGDGTSDSRTRFVWDYSPTLRVEYSKERNIRLFMEYRGNTYQPSMNQLMPIADLRDPLNKIIGNPDLLPGFSHDVYGGFSFSNNKTRSFINLHTYGNYNQRSIISKSTVDAATGARESTYVNADGDYNMNANLRYSQGVGNIPLTVDMGAGYGASSNQGYINGILGETTSQRPSASLTFRWNKEPLSVSLGSRANWGISRNNISTQLNRDTRILQLHGDISVSLPWNMMLTTDYNFTNRVGFNEALNGNYHLLNARLSKSFLKNNAATIELSWFDILGQRTAYSFTQTARNITDSFVETVTTYAMITFKYNFNFFGGGSPTAPDSSRSGRRYGGPGGYGHGGFRPR